MWLDFSLPCDLFSIQRQTNPQQVQPPLDNELIDRVQKKRRVTRGNLEGTSKNYYCIIHDANTSTVACILLSIVDQGMLLIKDRGQW